MDGGASAAAGSSDISKMKMIVDVQATPDDPDDAGYVSFMLLVDPSISIAKLSELISKYYHQKYANEARLEPGSFFLRHDLMDVDIVQDDASVASIFDDYSGTGKWPTVKVVRRTGATPKRNRAHRNSIGSPLPPSSSFPTAPQFSGYATPEQMVFYHVQPTMPPSILGSPQIIKSASCQPSYSHSPATTPAPVPKAVTSSPTPIPQPTTNDVSAPEVPEKPNNEKKRKEPTPGPGPRKPFDLNKKRTGAKVSTPPAVLPIVKSSTPSKASSSEAPQKKATTSAKSKQKPSPSSSDSWSSSVSSSSSSLSDSSSESSKSWKMLVDSIERKPKATSVSYKQQETPSNKKSAAQAKPTAPTNSSKSAPASTRKELPTSASVLSGEEDSDEESSDSVDSSKMDVSKPPPTKPEPKVAASKDKPASPSSLDSPSIPLSDNTPAPNSHASSTENGSAKQVPIEPRSTGTSSTSESESDSSSDTPSSSPKATAASASASKPTTPATTNRASAPSAKIASGGASSDTSSESEDQAPPEKSSAALIAPIATKTTNDSLSEDEKDNDHGISGLVALSWQSQKKPNFSAKSVPAEPKIGSFKDAKPLTPKATSTTPSGRQKRPQ